MTIFIKAIQNTLQSQTPSQHSQVETLTLRYIEFQKIQPETKLFLQRYSNISYLQISHCDLRTLDNFPNIHTLVELRLSHNKLQGSLENIIKLMGLEYLDLSHNIIRDVAKLLPLKRIKGLALYVGNNPFENKEGWRNTLSALNLKVEKEPKKHPLQPQEAPTVFGLKKEEQPPFSTPVRQSFRERMDRLDIQRAMFNKGLRKTKIEFRNDLKIEDVIEDIPPKEQPSVIQFNRRGRPVNSLMLNHFPSDTNNLDHAIKFEDDAQNSEYSIKDEMIAAEANNDQESGNSFLIQQQDEYSENDQNQDQEEQQQNDSSENYNQSYDLQELEQNENQERASYSDSEDSHDILEPM